MESRTLYILLIGLLCCALIWVNPVLARDEQGADNMPLAGQITLDFRDVELTDLVQTISELTGRNFLYDDSVKGKVTIISPDSMTLDEAYQLFLSVLYSKGYTIVPSGKINKIVSVKNAKQENLPTIASGQHLGTEQFVTQLVRLEHLDAETIANSVVKPLLPPYSNIITYQPTNTLIITDSAANIERLIRIVRELDQPGSASLLEVLPLKKSDAGEVAKVCQEILDQPSPTRRATRRDQATAVSQEVPSKIIPYTRTNVLIVMASVEDMTLIKELVAHMDQTPDSKRSNINLYYLENADADTLAATLNQILTGIKVQAAGKAGSSTKGPLTSGGVTITADKPTNSLIINASPEDYETLKGIIAQLDIKRKQVYVEALILELSMDATQKLGASLQGAGVVDNDGLVFGNSNFNNQTINPASEDFLLTRAVDGLLAGGFFNPISVIAPDGTEISVPTLSVLIDLSKTDSDVNILSAPRLLTSDNEEAEIIVGANVPVITGRLTDSGSNGLAQSVSVERQDVALILRFTPQVTEGDLVRLNVYQEITDIAQASVGNVNDVGPTFTKRVLRNTVLAENGKTVVLGGLIDTNVNESVTKVPLLGDIPLLGWLFKRKTTQEEKTNLLVFINPTIVKDAEDLARVTERNQKTASGFINNKMIEALPENTFGDNSWVTERPRRQSNE